MLRVGFVPTHDNKGALAYLVCASSQAKTGIVPNNALKELGPSAHFALWNATDVTLRENRLQLLTTMRSNDAWLGLPHDIFCFTMIQELVARSLGVELGDYMHFAGSLHLYASDIEKAARFQNEGMQRRVPMPPMPRGDPWPAVRVLLAFERKARRSAINLIDPRESMDPYWADLATLLAIHAIGKAKMAGDVIQRLKRRLYSDVYATYINRRFGWSNSERKQLTLIDSQGFIQKGEK